MRREGAAVAAVVAAVLGVLAPLTLGGRLASSADTDAFYAPFASFLHDRLAHGDIPYWAPGAFSGQPFLADAQSGVTYPPLLLASWLLGTRAQLRPIWVRYNILAKSVPETPAIIEHVSLIYGIDANGRIRVGYPASPLKSAWISHDAPILASAK